MPAPRPEAFLTVLGPAGLIPVKPWTVKEISEVLRVVVADTVRTAGPITRVIFAALGSAPKKDSRLHKLAMSLTRLVSYPK